jgi:tRNA U34 2-thiouridine synthase MnmA/TrmU
MQSKDKIHFLLKFAEVEKCDFISIGHYAIVQEFNNTKYIYKGKDPEKDQFFSFGD